MVSSLVENAVLNTETLYIGEIGLNNSKSLSKESNKSKKTWLYIDGFNFYYAIKNDVELPLGLAWCDFKKLATEYLIRDGTTLEHIKYFTAPVGNVECTPGESHRQQIWLKALQSIKELEIIYGYHAKHPEKLRIEKQTDVNIAVELLLGANRPDGYDNAILITADTDLIPAVKAVCGHTHSKKSVDVWIPPNMPNQRWASLAALPGFRCCEISPYMLASSRFPDRFEHNGDVIESLEIWQMPSGMKGLKWINVAS